MFWPVLLVTIAPFCWLLWGVVSNQLGPDPAEVLMDTTGEWALRFLVVVLLARPASQRGWPLFFRHRRMLGLAVFFYASLHLLVFAQVYIGWSAVILAEELAERPYVIVGAAAWVLLLPLAITSTNGWRRRLRQRWRQLHRAIYAVAPLVVLHTLWLARSDIGDVLFYAVLLGLLLIWRLPIVRRLIS
jgi:sulfoxide reductase heme-binding subunit YedZ